MTKKQAKRFVLCLAFKVCLLATSVLAQQPPFYNEVQGLKKKDSISYPAPNSILFTGSSSFTKWTDVQQYLPGYKIVNRAFGGSSIPDLIRYADEVIIPYNPKQIVIYCGDNDLASSDTITPEMVRNRFLILYDKIRQKLPQTNLLFVSLKPSPSRSRLMDKMVITNLLIEQFLQGKKNAAFADVYHPMLLPDGKPNPALFVEDNLHMNAAGYAIWKRVLQPYFLK